jgi:hypothetical protein
MARASYLVARTSGTGNATLRKSRPGAGAELVYQAQCLIEARAMRDTRAGWRFYRLALRVNRDICAGVVTFAELAFMGDSVRFEALA